MGAHPSMEPPFSSLGSPALSPSCGDEQLRGGSGGIQPHDFYDLSPNLLSFLLKGSASTHTSSRKLPQTADKVSPLHFWNTFDSIPQTAMKHLPGTAPLHNQVRTGREEPERICAKHHDVKPQSNQAVPASQTGEPASCLEGMWTHLIPLVTSLQ